MADIKSIEKWIKELITGIKLVSHDDLEDKNLMKELSKLSFEQGI